MSHQRGNRRAKESHYETLSPERKCWGKNREMLIVETIRKVRLALAKGESHREVAKKFRMSRNTVKKIAESNDTEFKYERKEKAFPVLGPHIEQLGKILLKEAELPKKARRTGKKIYEELLKRGVWRRLRRGTALYQRMEGRESIAAERVHTAAIWQRRSVSV
jgi:transposase